MLYVILTVLALIAGVSIAVLVLMHTEIKHMTVSLKKINDTKTNTLVRLSSPNRQLEMLAVEINRALVKKQEAQAQYKKMDITQRQNIANISHDLRTPLTSVLGYIQLLKDDSLAPEERSRYRDIVQRRAQDLNLLVTGFFDLSRLDAGEYGFHMQEIRIQNILCDMMVSFYPNFTEKGIQPEIDIDQSVPLITGDENAVRRVFSNLIQNALKYSKKTIEVVLKKEGDCIRTSFTNEAPQLTAEDASRLFERFYTAERMRSGQNTGLGLAITEQLVKNMNGKIGAEVTDGKLTIHIWWRV